MPTRPPLLPLLCAVAAAALALAHTGEVRERAEAALGKGMPSREAALARGFVLGQDGGIDEGTIEDFRRSGLAHLLAVSGQNVALLALLALPLLAALGMPLRVRLLWILGLIVVYVPLAGAGPSILRAGIMGALSVLATMEGRRASRLYALGVAAVITLVVDPAIARDVGWQLSFAAVLGILLLGTPLRGPIAARLGKGPLRRALADGAAMTIAATVATAPLVAFHFEGLPTATLFANLLAMPAVAPAMWLGMLAAAAGQVPGFPVVGLNGINALLLAYIAQVAAWLGRPSWAYLEVRLGLGGLVVSYLAIAFAAIATSRLARARRLTAARRRDPERSVRPLFHIARQRTSPLFHIARQRTNARPLVLSTAAVVAALVLTQSTVGGPGPESRAGLMVTVLDVSQGDAILLQPRGAPALLVDTGPPGEEITDQLREAGVEQLGAAIVTHDQSDHAGGVAELLGSLPVGRVLYGVLRRSTLARLEAAAVPARRLVSGSTIRSGPLRLEVLWPPAELVGVPPHGEDPNRLSLVLLARWRNFSMLLTGDAEAESVPLDPGPIDVLKVAHHGSEDAGLAALLERSRPRLAVISVGEENAFGHPTPATLSTLAAHQVPTLRTDRDGSLAIEVDRGTLRVAGG